MTKRFLGDRFPRTSAQRIVAALLALILAVALLPAILTPSHAIEATNDFDAYDALFSEQIEVLDWFFDLDTAFMQYTISTILYPWEEAEQSGWLPKRVSEEEFERVLYQHFVLSDQQLSQLRDECGYDAVDRSYQVIAYNSLGTGLRPRRYMGYVKLASDVTPDTADTADIPDSAEPAPIVETDAAVSDSVVTDAHDSVQETAPAPDPQAVAPILYDVFFQTIRYRRLDATDAPVMSALEAAGWPSVWEYEGIVYRLSTDGYVAITGYASEGICYRVELVNGYVRYHSARPFTASDLPEAFDHVNQVSITLPTGMSLQGAHEAFPDKSIIAVTKISGKIILAKVAKTFPNVQGDWQVYTILAPTLPQCDLNVTLLYEAPLSPEDVFAFYTDDTGRYRACEATTFVDAATQQQAVALTIPAKSQLTFGFCINAPDPVTRPDTSEPSEDTMFPDSAPEEDTLPADTLPPTIVTLPLVTLVPADTDPASSPMSDTAPADSRPSASTDSDDQTAGETVGQPAKKKGCKSSISPIAIGLIGLIALPSVMEHAASRRKTQKARK